MERFWKFTRSRETPCCSYNVVQFTLFVFNFVFWTGTYVTYVCVWALHVDQKLRVVANINLDWLYSPIYVASLFTAVVMYFGCCAAFLEQRKSLIVYAIFLVVLILLEVSSSAWTLFYTKTSFERFADKSFNTTIEKYGNLEEFPMKVYLEDFQKEYSCCALLSRDEWREAYKQPSCKCPDDFDSADTDTQHCVPPCGPYIKEYLTNTIILLCVAGLVFGPLKLVGILLALLLYRHPTTRIRTKRRRESRAGSSGNTSSGLFNSTSGAFEEEIVLPVGNGKDKGRPPGKKKRYLGYLKALPDRLDWKSDRIDENGTS